MDLTESLLKERKRMRLEEKSNAMNGNMLNGDMIPNGRIQFVQEESYVDILVYSLLDHWKQIVLVVLIGTVLAGAFHIAIITPEYEVDATMYITSSKTEATLSDLQMSTRLTTDYVEIIKSRTILLHLKTDYKKLSQLITVVGGDDTPIIKIIVKCADAELACDIANSLVNLTVDQIYHLIGNKELTVIDYAELAAVKDVTPSFMIVLIIGAFIAGVFICSIIILRTLMNTTIKTEEDVDKYLGLPVLVSVPYYTETK